MPKGNPTMGDRIKVRRVKMGISTAELAASVNVSEEAIKKIERGGSHGPSFQNGLLIAMVLGCDPLDIAFGGRRRLSPKLTRHPMKAVVGETAPRLNTEALRDALESIQGGLKALQEVGARNTEAIGDLGQHPSEALHRRSG